MRYERHAKLGKSESSRGPFTNSLLGYQPFEEKSCVSTRVESRIKTYARSK